MASVRLAGITKRFSRSSSPAVCDVNLEIADGEFMVLVGPSGCGKSTTLRIIAGLEEPTSGEVYIGDRLVNDVEPKDRDIAMVFQRYALYPHMTVRENLGFGLKLRRLNKSEIARRVEETAELLDIAKFLDRKPRALSGGEQQRVALGRAIVRKPSVFLFDEPLSNLDAKLRTQMRGEIKHLHLRLGATMIYVTHDQVEAMTMGGRITAMNEGGIRQVGAPLELYGKPADLFVAGFIGTPSMNFIRLSVDANNPARGICDEHMIELPANAADKLIGRGALTAYMGIRPESIHISPEFCSSPLEMHAIVELTEPLGNETFVHVSAGKLQLTLRATDPPFFRHGDRIKIFIDVDRAHFFDAASGERAA